MRLKIVVGLTMLALAGAVVTLALALISQEEESTGRVRVTGDLIEVSPETDWLVIDSDGAAGTSGIQKLTFTNVSNATSTITELLRIDEVVMGPDPSVFDDTLSLEIAFLDPSEVFCGPPLGPPLVEVPWPPGSLALNRTIKAGGSAVLCGKLSYDGSADVLLDGVDLTFVFGSETSP